VERRNRSRDISHVKEYRRWYDIPIAIQLSHAGRKASTEVPWKGGVQFAPDHPLEWQTVAPSAMIAVTLHSIPGITGLCFQSFAGV
jgi:2,4-dienoyl-CoA reductase-like NADH-dependent reductase (Old Yellow Enzyme family)